MALQRRNPGRIPGQDGRGAGDFDLLADSEDFAALTRMLSRLVGLPMALNSPRGAIVNRTAPEDESPLCALVQGSKEGYRRCRACDRRNHALALAQGRSRIYRCHAGFVDMAAPILVEGRRVASISSGQVLPEPHSEAGFRRLRRRLAWLKVPEKRLRAAYQGARFLPRDKLDAVLGLMNLFAQRLCEHERLLRALRARPEREEIVRVKALVEGRFHDPSLALGDAAAQAGLSPAHFSGMFKREIGISFTRFVQARRVTEVKRRLTGTRASITEIGLDCGFCSLTHLNRVFRSFECCSPRAWRARQQRALRPDVRPATEIVLPTSELGSGNRELPGLARAPR